MSERIITLFGEEIIPEQVKAVGRSRAKKKTDEKKDDASAEGNNEETIAVETVPPVAPAEPVSIINNNIETTPEQPQQAMNTDEDSTFTDEMDEDPEELVEETESSGKVQKSKVEKKPNLPEDWQGEKQYYSIGEVADLFKVKTSHIRFWTNEFKLKVRTTRKGDRLYTAAQIREIRAIHHLVKERGFTLSGAKAKLAETGNMDVKTVDLRQSLLQLRNKLTAIKNQLK